MNLGRYGEDIAVSYLEKKGYKVVARNFRCQMGEIDIVAIKGNLIIFVEVKTRRGLTYGIPAEAITTKKLAHIQRVAQIYSLRNHLVNLSQRIDVIEILHMGEKNYIRHTENVIS